VKYRITYTDKTGTQSEIITGETKEECRKKAIKLVDDKQATAYSDQLITRKRKLK